MMFVDKLVVLKIREGKEFKALHHVSAVATRDDQLSHSQQYYNFFIRQLCVAKAISICFTTNLLQ